MKRFTLFACFALSCTATARAQTLAEHVPGDAIVYLGWKGADTADNGYANSHLQAIVDASGWADVRDQVIPQLMAKITAQSNDHGEGALAAKTTLTILWRHPTAIFFAGVDDSGPAPKPRLGLICRAEGDSDALMTILNAAVHGPGADPTSRAFVTDKCTVFTLGYPDEHAIPGDADKAKSLQASADFDRMTTATGKDALISAYADFSRGMEQIDAAVDRGEDDTAKDAWPKVRDASGLSGLKHFAYSGTFSGKDWISQSFVEAPLPRNGLLTILETKPIDKALVSRIPSSASSSILGTLDLGGLLKQIRIIADAAHPDGGAMFDKAMGVAQMFIGRSLQHDIIEPLGSEWAIYNDASIPSATFTAPATGPQFTGKGDNTVVVNKLVDPAKAAQGWKMMSYAINNALGRFTQRQGSQISTAMTQNGDDPVFTVNTPFAQPSWTIHDGYLYLGTSAAGVTAAANGTAATTLTTQSPAFVDLAKQLVSPSAPASFTGFQFANLPMSILQMYPNFEQSLTMLRKLAEQQSITLPAKILPPLDQLQAELEPALSISWADDAGWHNKSRAPVPGAAPQPDTIIAGGGLLGASIALPSLSRARGAANRVKSASNERQIGQAMLLYGNDHKGNYPATMGDLIEEEITPQVFVRPGSDTDVPKNLAPADTKKWINEHSDYVYVAAGTNTSVGAEQIMVYEKPEADNKQGLNILFGDGHVEFVLMPNAVAMIEDQNKTVPGVDLPDVSAK